MDLRERYITRALARVEVTPEGWDRDCRCCMSRANNDKSCPEPLFSRRAIKGAGVQVVVIHGEEIHAWHSVEDVDNWLAFEEAQGR